MSQLFDQKHGPRFHNDLVENFDRIAKVEGFLGVCSLVVYKW